MARRPKRPRPAAFINDPLWYKDAVIYQVHVKSYYDANGDGIGDFQGLIERLDYIASLGVNTIWLLPFYPSPRRDDGYDISDYRAVHPDYGDLATVRRFIDEAHRRGLRVIAELVINHTSDQHPWFQRARLARKGSRMRDFYVWSDTNQKYQGTRIIFIDTETSNWTWDPVARQYYWHRFYSHQPDLNFDNPMVLRGVLSIMRFWLDLGIDGLRLDAIPYLIERDGTNNENLPETHEVLKQIRAEIDANYPDRMLLAEANQWPEDTRPYFGEGDECHMAFHFPLMPRMYMAIAQEDRYPITDILRQTPEIPENCQWAIFLRNHDELTLEMVTDHERDYLWNVYAADRRARLNLGIRRRLAPLVERDRRRIELLHSLLLSMPGTPTLYYGDEIGMGDNIYLGDRDGVRTPMQWSSDRNGGFSRADPASLVLPPIMDPLYGYQSVNVEAQLRDAHSLLNWTRRMLAVRKQQKAFGRGTLKMLAPSNRRILAYLREYTGVDGRHEIILCVANLSRAAQAAELELSAYGGKVPVEMLGGSAFPPIGELPYLLTLPPYGFYWFLLADATQMPAWHQPALERMPELMTLVIKRDLHELVEAPLRDTLESEILPTYLAKRRWFAGGAEGRVRLIYLLSLLPNRLALCEVEVESDEGPVHYQLPLAFVGDGPGVSALSQALTLCRLRRRQEVGLLTDAVSLPEFTRQVLTALREQREMDWRKCRLHFEGTAKLAELEMIDDEPIEPMSSEQSNSSIRIGERMVLKVIRRIRPGVHPEAEMGGYLTEQGFPHIAPLLGEVRRTDADGNPHTLMLLQGYLESQGDAWNWTLSNLERAIRDELAGGISTQENQFGALEELEAFAHMLGRRLGEMHQVLARPTEEPAFATRTADDALCEAWGADIARQLREALQLLDSQRSQLPAEVRAEAAWLSEQSEALQARVQALARQVAGGLVMRVHGDLHLGQVLVVGGDAYLIDFEGEPERSLEERRAKHSPYKDVTGVLRSFDYAAALAMRNAQGSDSSEEAARARRDIAGRYLQESRSAFLDGYRRAAAELPHAWREEGGEAAALALFGIEKAAYELRYEARYRPDWLEVPLHGLVDLCSPLLEKPHD